MICVYVFPDNDAIRNLLEKPLLTAEAAFRAAPENQDRWVGGGGAKIRDFGSWDCPAVKLLHERAKRAFRQVTGASTAFIDDCWANVSRPGEFIGPHAHRRTEVSVVYHLVPPREEECDVYNGALCFADPRIKKCCPTRDGFLTSQIYTPMAPGTMVVFPSFATHLVTPHTGDGHRISIAWNIARQKIPGRPEDQPLL